MLNRLDVVKLDKVPKTGVFYTVYSVRSDGSLFYHKTFSTKAYAKKYIENRCVTQNANWLPKLGRDLIPEGSKFEIATRCLFCDENIVEETFEWVRG